MDVAPPDAPDAVTPAPRSRAEARRARAAQRAAARESAGAQEDDTGAPHGPIALTWVDEARVAAGPPQHEDPGEDLLDHRPRRGPGKTATLVPLGAVVLLAGSYVAAALMWPLNHVEPTVTVAPVADLVAPVSAVTWPDDGSAAVGVDGVDAVAASGDEPTPMASITKLITALVVLDAQPLEPGETGPEFTFSSEDRAIYWQYLARGESALAVPRDGAMTQYQLLQGMLIGSAGNYAEKLTVEQWPTDREFAAAANRWLDEHGINGITVADRSGFDDDNVATPAALVALAEAAMADPVIAEIVGTRSVELPSAGLVENTNDLLDDGATGVKTGTLWGDYNVLASDQVTVGDTDVAVFAAVLDQPSNRTRFAEAERLLADVAAEVDDPVVLPAGTVAGTVTTLWGDRSRIVTDADASVALWNGATAVADASLGLRAERAAGDAAGTLTVTGPIDGDEVGLVLTATITEPDGWWRLTHPFELFGFR